MDWDLPPAWWRPSITQDGRTIYQVGTDWRLSAFDAATGAVRWTAKRPPVGVWFRGTSYADGVVALYGPVMPSTGVCRFDGAGVRRWCVRLDRPVLEADVGRTGTGLSVRTYDGEILVLDPATGATLTGWFPVEDLLLDRSPGDRSTIFNETAEVVGLFGRVTVVVDSRAGTVAGYRRGAVAWTLPLDEPHGLWDSADYDGTLAFDAWTGRSFAVVRVGPELIGIAADGRLAWHQTAPPGRVVIVGTRLALVSDQDVRGIDPANGAERWQTPIDGIGAVEGELGDLVVLEREQPARDVVWVDPATGQIAARTPLGGRVGAVTSIPGRLLAVDGAGAEEDPRFSVLARDGVERWSMAGGLWLYDSVGIRSATDEFVDLGTGAILGPSPGSRAGPVGRTWLECVGWPPESCYVGTIPRTSRP